MEEIGEKYLPIGTVVMLKGGTKRVMISGFCAIDGENVKNMYDYSEYVLSRRIFNINTNMFIQS